jgi:hypothetical protein
LDGSVYRALDWKMKAGIARVEWSLRDVEESLKFGRPLDLAIEPALGAD